MTDEREDRTDYERAREEFGRMKLEDQAAFLLEAGATTFLRGVEAASAKLADELDKWKERRAREREKNGGTDTDKPVSDDAASPA